MQLGETIATHDVELALRGESGKFEVSSPLGETYYVTRKPNDLALKSQLLDQQSYPQAFLIKKIAESVLLEQSSRLPATLEETSPASDSRVPFLLENREREDKSLSDADRGVAAVATESGVPEVWSLDLLYIEGESVTGQPAASVYLITGTEDSTNNRAGKPLTSPCRSFKDLDSEIRRLQAQLEGIRVRAKKRFYKAQAAAASA